MCIFRCPDDGVREYRVFMDECPQTYDGCSLEAKSLSHERNQLPDGAFLRKTIDLDKCQPPQYK
jgi:hypothetical protein